MRQQSHPSASDPATCGFGCRREPEPVRRDANRLRIELPGMYSGGPWRCRLMAPPELGGRTVAWVWGGGDLAIFGKCRPHECPLRFDGTTRFTLRIYRRSDARTPYAVMGSRPPAHVVDRGKIPPPDRRAVLGLAHHGGLGGWGKDERGRFRDGIVWL